LKTNCTGYFAKYVPEDIRKLLKEKFDTVRAQRRLPPQVDQTAVVEYNNDGSKTGRTAPAAGKSQEDESLEDSTDDGLGEDENQPKSRLHSVVLAGRTILMTLEELRAYKRGHALIIVRQGDKFGVKRVAEIFGSGKCPPHPKEHNNQKHHNTELVPTAASKTYVHEVEVRSKRLKLDCKDPPNPVSVSSKSPP
jgi:hypothetical protein